MKQRSTYASLAFVFLSVLSGCFHRPPPMVSESQPGGIFQHTFAPDYTNYGVCRDTLAMLWGKSQGNQMQLWVSWATQPLQWAGTEYAGTTDTAGLREWGAIPSKLPFDFECRQSLLTPSIQSKNFEVYQSPVNAPFRCTSLYDYWLTIVDRNSRRAYPTAMPLVANVEIVEWQGKLWIADQQGMYEVDPEGLAMDSDKDGLTDMLERLLGTLPDEADSDQDGKVDAIDTQPQAGPRAWSHGDSLLAQDLVKRVLGFPTCCSCVRFVNVVAPHHDPLEVTIPSGLRLVWNVPDWRGDSLVVETRIQN